MKADNKYERKEEKGFGIIKPQIIYKRR